MRSSIRPGFVGHRHFVFFRAYLAGGDLTSLASEHLFLIKSASQARKTVSWLIHLLLDAARRLDLSTLHLEAAAVVYFARNRGNWRVAEHRDEAHRSLQLRSLVVLENTLARDPHVDDLVEHWFGPGIVTSLLAGEIATIGSLIKFINEHGRTWHKQFRTIGKCNASNIERWISAHSETLEISLNTSQLGQRRWLAIHSFPSLARTTGVVPMELLQVPVSLSGRLGSNRSPESDNEIAAGNDYDAISEWLETCNPGSRTWRSYRVHGERVLLWAILVKRKAVSSLTENDCTEYFEFLRDPQPATTWIGPHGVDRWSAQWKPFCAKPSLNSWRMSVAVTRLLFQWLVRSGYLRKNPVRQIPLNASRPWLIDARRSFNRFEWRALAGYVDQLERGNLRNARLRFALLFAYGSGVTLGELSALKINDLVPGCEGKPWMIKVHGRRRGAGRLVLFQEPVKIAFAEYFRLRGLVGRRDLSVDTPLLARLTGEVPIQRDGLAAMFTQTFRNAAAAISETDPVIAQRLRMATTHWLRHTHGVRAASEGVRLETVRANMGHSSADITRAYFPSDGELDRLFVEADRLFH